MSSRAGMEEGAALHLALSPGGNLHLAPDPGGLPILEKPVARRLEQAFEQGPGSGLLHLGGGRLSCALPPTLHFWRELGLKYMTRLCAVANLEEQREKVRLPAPLEELEDLAAKAPPMVGGEYLTPQVLADLWARIERAFQVKIAAFEGEVQEYLKSLDPLWNIVGKVCFHLAENKRSTRTPFAFMATYAARLSSRARVQHRPLAEALKEYAGAGNREALLALLAPVQQSAARSPFLKEMVDSRSIFQPLAWTPAQAYRFLRDIPIFEQCGVVVRVPDWWKGQRPRRPKVSVTVGARSAAALGLEAMLDFEVAATLDGEPLSEEEWRELMESASGLVLIKGQWVEVDRQKLDEALTHWKRVQGLVERDGLSFSDGLRLLCGVTLGGTREEELAQESCAWMEVKADPRLGAILSELRSPEALEAADPGDELKAELRPYQELGVRWLWFLHRLGLGACLADDMGLGKTIQVLALLLVIKGQREKGTSLLVVPASLIANWKAEIERFTPALKTLVAHASEIPSAKLARLSKRRIAEHDVLITSYASLLRQPWSSSFPWHLVVLDEAQAIKNPDAKQTRAAKALKSRGRIVLTGTPIENRLSELWSLFDFICPGLLGSSREFGAYTKKLAARENGSWGPLRELVRPYILRRLKSDKRIIADLPDKSEVRAFCGLSRNQAALYQQSVEALAKQLEELEGIERRGVVLAFLLRFKQICNHPSQWLGDGAYQACESGKFNRLGALCEEIAARQEKVLIFTQFRQIIDPLAEFLAGVFGRQGLVLHGGIAVKKRKPLVDAFQREDGPPFFVLSLKAGGTGLNLTAAAHVIHFDRWWNPAVENQATDRAYRIGQRRNVLVHKFICRGTVEERIDEMIESKKQLSEEILAGGGGSILTELPNEELIDLVSLDIHSALEES